MQIDPSTLPPVLLLAIALAIVTALTKAATGWWAAGWDGIALRGRIRAGAALVSRGEFSIVIAGLGATAGIEPRLAPLAAAYVLILAVSGPIIARFAEPIADVVQNRVERMARTNETVETVEVAEPLEA